MKYLHQQGIIHRDLKSDNILMDANYYPHICDFGLSKCMKNFLSATMTGAIGTPIYIAPELFDEEPHYTTKVDVFAFAVLAYEIVTEKVPYNELCIKKKINPFALGNKILKGYRPKFPDDFPPKLKDLIEKCWSPTANERPSFDEIFAKLSSDFSYLDVKLDEEKIREYIRQICDTSNNDNKESANDEIKTQIDALVSKFYSAIEKSDTAQIEQILSSKIVDVNTRFDINNESKTALHIAIENDNKSLVTFLLKQEGIDVNAKSVKIYPFEQIKGEVAEYSDDEDRKSAKHSYLDEVEERNEEIRRYKVPPDFIEKYGKSIEEKTPLHVAIENGNVNILQLLLKHEKIDINIKSRLSKFRKYIEEVHREGCTYYELTSKHIIEEITALNLAIEKQNIQIVKYLLTDERTDVNIKTFISKKEYYNTYNKSQAKKFKIRQDYFKYFSHYGKFKYEETSALQIAVEKGNSEIVSLLLDSEIIDVNIKSKSEIDYLDVSNLCRDIYEKTALHLAIEKNNLNIIELLLKHKFIDVNISMIQEDPWNINHKTPLYIAIEGNNFGVVQLLLQEKSIDVNLTSYFSKKGKIAPIFIAIKKENIDIINLLLNYEGININVIDHKGRKPIDKTQNKQIIALINKKKSQ